MQGLRSRVVAAILAGALLFPTTLAAQSQPAAPSFRSPTDEELRTTKNPAANWITYGGALNGQRYSTLDQVNASNVAGLKGAWMTRLGSGRGAKYRFEPDPLVIDGVMYIPTGNDDIYALDAKTGKKLWTWESDIPQVNDLICCGWDNRGVASGQGMIYSGLLDGSIAGIDQKTGKTVWRTQLEDYHDGYSITGATRYYDGMVFTGMSGGENGVRGRMTALDAKTGKEVWRFYTVPGPNDIGGDSWPNDGFSYLHGGATVWQAPSIDPELGLMYFSTGNAGPWNGDSRPGDSLFAASIVSLDYKTGQYRWHFQEVHHDIWDFDAPSPTVLFDQTYGSEQKKGMFQCGKTGWCYLLDRATGKPLVGIDEKAVPQEPRNNTAATQPYPVGDSFVDQCGVPVEGFPLAGCIFTPFFDVPVVLRPTAGGGAEFSPMSYSAQTGYIYATGLEQNLALANKPIPFELGRKWVGVTITSPLGSDITSTLTALDSRTNKIVWQKRKPGEDNKGAMSTASGLVFTGQADGNAKAYDARTGDELWSFQTGWGIGAAPMTYSVDGEQYVVFMSGGNRGGVTTLDGDAVWSFKLNGTLDEVPAAPPVTTKTAITGRIVQMGDALNTPGNVYDTVNFEGTIPIDDFFFTPRRVQVAVGTTVNWENKGALVHTATENKGTWDTGDIAPGATKGVTFDTPGTYNYTCSPHPWMYAQIIVQ